MATQAPRFLSPAWWDTRARKIAKANAGVYYVAKCPACGEWRIDSLCRCDLKQHEVTPQGYRKGDARYEYDR